METIGFDLRQTQRTPLMPNHVDALRAAGVQRNYPAGKMLAGQGDLMDRFIWIESGEVEWSTS
jgi:thioredoxin reductase (NADPH)